MKGLLIKDFMLLKNQKQFFAMIILIGFAFLALYDSPDFVISYVSIMFTMFTISTITYDEYDNGMAYLFSLPVSRKGYTGEKYIFGILTALVSLAGVSVLAWLSVPVRHMEYSVEEWAAVAGVSLLMVAAFLALMIPLQLKFEADKSRIAMVAVVGGFILAVYLVAKLLQALNIALGEIVERLIEVNVGVLVAGGGIMIVGILFISYLVSVNIMKKKEL